MKMKVGGTTKFSWRNYSRPTPQNFLRLALLVKRILYAASTGSLFQENHWITGGLIIAIPLTEELVQFLSDASDAANTVHVEADVNKDAIVLDPPKV